MKKQSPWIEIPAVRTFEHLRAAVSGYTYSRIILTSLELDIFSVIGKESWTSSRLARAMDASERGTNILCRNLASLGLLSFQNGRYKNSPLSATSLNRKSPEYRGAYLSLLQKHWNEWSQLTASVKSGKPHGDNESGSEEEDRRAFTWAMHHRSRDIAPLIAQHIDLRGASTLLDVGGGPGTYTLALLAKWPKLHGTVGDRPAALQVARAVARKHPSGKRLSYLELDFMEEKIPGNYDVVFLSNVVHIYDPNENITLLKKIKAALNPNGRIIIQDFFLWDKKGLRPIETNLFAATMLLCSDTGNTYSAQEVKKWMTKAGFRNVSTIKTAREPLLAGHSQ
tara:strand:+ start:203 stop:1219 length:1017 start_codon:yes stop_codon:yes gene_type:complete